MGRADTERCVPHGNVGEESEPALRRAYGNDHLYLRTTAINASGEVAIKDVPTSGDHVLTGMRVVDCTTYTAQTTGVECGGYNSSATNYTSDYEIWGHTWHFVTGNTIDDALLNSYMAGERVAGSWKFHEGSTTYTGGWSGAHPGWPVISALIGAYDLDADVDGADDGNPYEI